MSRFALHTALVLALWLCLPAQGSPRRGRAVNGPVVTVQATFAPSPRELTVRLHITNEGVAPVLLLDRLWDLVDGKHAPDPDKVYRFVRRGTLRLLLGMAPLPTTRTPFFKNVPFATRLPPHRSIEETLVIPLPAKEHNVYFPVEEGSSPWSVEKAHSAEVFVQYVVEEKELATSPSPFDPQALKIMTPGAWDAAKTARSTAVPVDIQVVRRTDELERFTVPDDLP